MKHTPIWAALAVAGLTLSASNAWAANPYRQFPTPRPGGSFVEPRVTDGPLTDGGFEATDPNTFVNQYWAADSAAWGSPICDDSCLEGYGPRTGTYFTLFSSSNDDSVNPEYVSQDALIPLGSGARLEFYAALPDCDASLWSFSVLVDQEEMAGWDESSSPAFPIACGPTTYGLVSVDISKYADGQNHTIELLTSSFGAGVFNLMIDDVSLVTTPFAYFRMSQTAQVPPDADCADPVHYGRMIYATEGDAVYVCTDNGWRTVTPLP